MDFITTGRNCYARSSQVASDSAKLRGSCILGLIRSPDQIQACAHGVRCIDSIMILCSSSLTLLLSHLLTETWSLESSWITSLASCPLSPLARLPAITRLRESVDFVPASAWQGLGKGSGLGTQGFCWNPAGMTMERSYLTGDSTREWLSCRT